MLGESFSAAQHDHDKFISVREMFVQTGSKNFFDYVDGSFHICLFINLTLITQIMHIYNRNKIEE